MRPYKCFFSAWDTFLIDPITMLSNDKFVIDLSISHNGMLVNASRTADVDLKGNVLVPESAIAGITLDEIEIHVYYYDLTPEQKQTVIETRNNEGITFAYRTFSSRKQTVDSNGTYHNTSMTAPSALLQKFVCMFTNEGTERVFKSPTNEIKFDD